jgi:hypothetical protein
MATIKNYTSLEQSKVLNKILSDKSADMTWSTMALNGESKLQALDVPYCKVIEKDCPEFIERNPCWSLSALLNVLPKIEHLKPFIDLSPELDSDKVAIYYHSEDSPYIVKDNLLDAAFEMIVWLKENKKL